MDFQVIINQRNYPLFSVEGDGAEDNTFTLQEFCTGFHVPCAIFLEKEKKLASQEMFC